MPVIEMIDVAARELMLFAATGFLIGGIDDLAIDLVFLCHRSARRGDRRLADLARPAQPPRLAVLVPAWREARVIGAMLTTALARYRHPDFLIFVAAYRNDPATVDAIAAVAERDRRVRLVLNPRPGPTTKADNLNAAWAAACREEAASGRGFAAVLLHDAEDVVHPDELSLCSALIAPPDGGGVDVVQLPVVPLVHPGSPFVSGHYADEFAESHQVRMQVRQALGAGMPLAGTGCAVASAMLRRVAATRCGLPFDPDSLTEDYELGLAIAALGGRSVFARCRDADGGLIAVRSYFPLRFTQAARQKARWMVGIALAGWDRIGWAPLREVGDHWMRMRDRRGPIAVVVLAAAYLALIGWACSGMLHLWRGDPAGGQVPGWLLRCNVLILVWRLASRVTLTARAHGWREGAWAAPRFIVGNFIALAAGPRALAVYLPTLFGRAPHWDKTEHQFPGDIEMPPSRNPAATAGQAGSIPLAAA